MQLNAYAVIQSREFYPRPKLLKLFDSQLKTSTKFFD